MGSYCFGKDLAQAKLTEKEVAQILCEKEGQKVEDVVYSNKAKGWDFEYRDWHDMRRLCEVKEDFFCAKTGNVAIEIESRGKPSGITTSVADDWCIKAHTQSSVEYILIKSSTLHCLVRAVTEMKLTEIEGYKVDLKIGGDSNSNTVMVLFPLELIKEFSQSRTADNPEWVDGPLFKDYSYHIFVFGSNLNGAHKGGAAAHAFSDFGARMGVFSGRTGNAYAIPTLDEDMKQLPLPVIEKYAKQFIEYATLRPYLQFYLTGVGCGIAGFKVEQIAPFFRGTPRNVDVCDEFQNYLSEWDSPVFDIDEFCGLDNEEGSENEEN